ncbi:MAG: right-handed parallel beta-helix repeat-containing protein, partial [Planctomycetota bacterium]
MTMASNLRVWRLIPLLLIVVIFCPFAYSKVIYVDDDAVGLNDGSSWNNAYTFLQDALIDANDLEKPVEIRVAQGTYKPNQGIFPIIPAGVGGRSNEPYPAKYPADLGNKASFNLINDVTIKGGYAGLWESDPNVREIELYETILSGDLNGDDIEVNDPCDLFDVPDRYDNSNTVVTGSNIDETAVLDGFTITGGHSMVIPNGSPAGGGGMWIISGSPMLINCTFAENAVHGEGAGLLAQDGSSPTLVNCTLARNAAVTGGGMSNWRNGSPLLVDCRFDGNYARFRGGGMYNYESDAKLINCTFSNNSSVGSGAGMSGKKSNLVLNSCTFTENTGGHGAGIFSEDKSTLALTSCTFRNNSTEGLFGGGMCNEDANDLMLANCTFSGNSAKRDGGGIFNRRSTSTLINCVFSGNKASGGSANDSGCAGLYAFGDTTLINCTFCGNWAQQGHAIFKYSSSDLRLTNCILWDGGSEIFQKSGVEPDVVYSNIQGGWEGDGNIDADPLFADFGHWASVNDPDIVIEPNHPDAIWIDGDYHLKSQAGRWDPASENWIQDDATSPCIDAGDPNSPIGHEPFPNGGIINMGAYGGTAQASKSLHGKIIYILMPGQSMVIQTGGIAGVDGTYILSGQFQLTIDFGAGKARFSKVEAIATDHSEPVRKLDPNDFFNL